MLYRTLQRAFSHNPRIYGHAITRTSALSSFNWSVVSLDKSFDKKIDATRARIAAVVTQALQYQLRTVLYGSALLKLKTINNPTTGNTLFVEKVFEPWEYDYDEATIYIINEQNKVVSSIDRAQNQTEYLFDCNLSLPRGGALRSIMPSEILRNDMVLENANYLKKLKGIFQIIVTGGGEGNQAAAEAAAKTAVQNNYVITDDMIQFKLNEIVANSGGAFKDFISARDAEIAIGLVGQANTSELPKNGGSRAALQVLQLVSADIFYSDMNRVETFFNQLLLMDYKLNYSANAVIAELPEKFLFNIAEEKDIEKVANGIALLAPIVPLKKEEVYNAIGFTAPKEGDELFIPRSNPAIGNPLGTGF